MPAFAGAKGMAGAGTVDLICKVGIAGATMFANVFGFFGALTQCMFAFVRTQRMTRT